MIGEMIKKQLDELTPQSSSQPRSELFEHIELTEEEKVEAMRAAREKKYFEIRQQEYRASLAKQTVYRTYTSSELLDLFKMQYDVDEDNGPIIGEVCRYFAGDPKFIGDLNKGLLLMGGVGVGKTSIMKFFFKNQRQSYRVESCREVESKYSEMGENYIDRCSHNLPVAVNSDPFGHQQIGFCFDDLGTEANAKHFGKEKNVMAEIILNRYDNNLPFMCTHITTNLTAEQVKAQYGTRVTDRIRQMFNLIQFPVKAKSRR